MATGAALTPETGLRFALSPDGELAPDFSARLPGRGAWLTPDRALLDAALKKGAFARSFKAGVTAPADLAERVEAGLAKQALSALGLARRAGDVATGFEKVRAMLADGTAAVLVNAADGGEDGRRKLARVAGDAAVVELFSEAELAAALGRDGPTVHVGVKAGPAAQRFLKEARRLTGFRRGEKAAQN
ncbi:RNA-binding protein [Hyphococcus luteus]|uniref:RNA-binding protein n=1 Tax=Hyphococcus luteus TaxID=2058213 RepID=UPI0013FE3556|nr:RNA-binding protein [Marinicaulis flavus]